MLVSILCFALISHIKVYGTPALSYLAITRVGPCQSRKATEIVTIDEMSIHKDSHGALLSGPMNVTKDSEDGWNVKVTMQKCHDIRNLDTCDLYKAFTIIRSGCEDSEQANIYNMFFKYVTPKMSCPVKAGNYMIQGFPFYAEDSTLMAAESKISTSVFGYTYKIEGLNEESDRIFCVNAYLRMVYVRKHNWIEGHVFDTDYRKPAPKKGIDKKDEQEDAESGDNLGDNLDNRNNMGTTDDSNILEEQSHRDDPKTDVVDHDLDDHNDTGKDNDDKENDGAEDTKGSQGNDHVINTDENMPGNNDDTDQDNEPGKADDVEINESDAQGGEDNNKPIGNDEDGNTEAGSDDAVYDKDGNTDNENEPENDDNNTADEK